MFETIVALATAPMKSALAIVRLSGDDCFNIVNKMFTKDISKTTKRDIYYGNIIDGNKVIDEVVLLAYKNPHSFTGEDSVEIISHGSVLIAKQIIDLALSKGARLATNGEFSSRAYLNHKIDLVQAEAINDLINATTVEGKELSILALEGKSSEIFKPIKNKLGELLAKIEVNIDYPEYEDIEEISRNEIVETSTKIVDSLCVLIANGEKDRLYHEGVKIAIVGKPNVGKSSLLNELINEDKAIVTDIAGTTRDIVEGEINLSGIVLHLLDTAGIRDVEDKVESIGVNKSKDAIKEADLVIVLLDASNELDEQDKEILELVKDVSHIITYNKVDKSNNRNKEGIYISALNNDITPLKDAIYEKLGLKEETFRKPSLNNTRQLGLLRNVKENLLKAKEDALNDLPIDLISVSLHDAYNSVLEILGEYNQTDISKEIFSRFCVGK